MKRFSKVSFDDIKTIQVDSGVLLKEFDVKNPVFLPENVICATSGGINPVCVPEYYDFGEDVDNAKTAKETKRIRGWNATISFTTFTTSLDLIRLALGAADISGKVLSIRQKLQYAKDFKDIWWVGERADGIIVAIKLIRSLSDSGFSLQTNKRGKGQISVTLKGHSSFAEKDKIPMEIYVLAESDIPIVPDEPETPTASMYIYGTPTTGVKYNGVELPDIESVWTDKNKYPYWYIYSTDSKKYWLNLCAVKMTISDDGTQTIYGSSGARKDYHYTVGTNDEWVYNSSGTQSSGTFGHNNCTFEAANYDILTQSGNVYLAASEPVHSGNIGLRVGGSVTMYDGAVLPDINTVYTDELKAKCPNAVIRGYTDKQAVVSPFYGRRYLHISSEPFWVHASNSSTDNGLYLANLKTQYWVCEYGVDNEWKYKGEFNHDNQSVFNPDYSWDEYSFVWANHDVENTSNNTVYQIASDPIPVSGIVDTINGIPIYE